MFSLKIIKSVNFENLAAHSCQSDVGLPRRFHEVDNVSCAMCISSRDTEEVLLDIHILETHLEKGQI